MRTIRCVFCSETATRSKEHVWPQWLQDALSVRENVSAWVHRSVVGNAVSRRVQNTASILLGHVCGQCNNGWMSEIEGGVRVLMQSLLPEVAGRTLSAKEATDLALWAFKTAIVLNASSNYRRIVPQAHFEYLYANRQVPLSVVVDTAHLGGNEGVTSTQSQHFVGAVSGDTEGALSQIRTSGYNIALGVGALAFRVVHLPVPNHVVLPELAR